MSEANRQLKAVTEAICHWRNDKKHQASTWNDLSDHVKAAYLEQAQAAIDASDAKYVPMLVEALKKLACLGIGDLPSVIGADYIREAAKLALQQLPEDLR